VTQDEVVGEVIDALDQLGLVYMIVGSFASNFHGVPRMTQDADLVIALDEAGAIGLVRALEGAFYDWPYLDKWAIDLGVRDLLDRAQRAASP